MTYMIFTCKVCDYKQRYIQEDETTHIKIYHIEEMGFSKCPNCGILICINEFSKWTRNGSLF